MNSLTECVEHIEDRMLIVSVNSEGDVSAEIHAAGAAEKATLGCLYRQSHRHSRRERIKRSCLQIDGRLHLQAYPCDVTPPCTKTGPSRPSEARTGYTTFKATHSSPTPEASCSCFYSSCSSRGAYSAPSSRASYFGTSPPCSSSTVPPRRISPPPESRDRPRPLRDARSSFRRSRRFSPGPPSPPLAYSIWFLARHTCSLQ